MSERTDQGQAPTAIVVASTMGKFMCRGCQFAADIEWPGRCPGCGRWYDIVPPIRKAGDAQKTTLGANAKPAERILTGIEALDRILGDPEHGELGAAVPSVVLIAGKTGSGKSTMLLQAINNMTPEGKFSFWQSGEQTRDQLGTYSYRMDIKNDRVEVIGNDEEGGDVYKAVERCEAPGRPSPTTYVGDSLNRMWLNDFGGVPGSTEQMIAVAKYFCSFAANHKCVVFLVAHLNAAGEVAGPEGAKHDVDAMLMMDYLDKANSPSLRTLMATDKNRFGVVGAMEIMEMTREGFRPPERPKARPGSRLWVRQ